MSERAAKVCTQDTGRGSRAVVLGAVAALAGLMFGLDIGVIAGAVRFIKSDFGISDGEVELIVSAMMFGAAVGAVMASRVSAVVGRKPALLIGAIVFVIGAVASALSGSPTVLIGSRIVLGLAIGVLTFTAPLYLAEIAPKQRRGALIASYQTAITIGVLIAFLTDTALSGSGHWRWMLGLIAIPGTLFAAGTLALPRSPRWLMTHGRRTDAESVLRRLRVDQALVEQELTDIESQLTSPQHGWLMFLRNSNFRRSVALGIALQVIQQFTGMNVVSYYAPRIFQDMGYAAPQQMWFTVLVGAVSVLATFIAIGFVDRIGRRPILYTGFGVMAVGLGVVGAMMSLSVLTHTEQFFTVGMLLVFIVGFQMSAGPLVWTICSEVQPLQGRDFGIGCSTVANWVANMVVGATFLTLLDSFGNANTFWLYSALNVIFILVTLLFVPETKGVSLEQIERKLMNGMRLRNIGA